MSVAAATLVKTLAAGLTTGVLLPLVEIQHFVEVAETPTREFRYRPKYKNEVAVVIPTLNEADYIEDCLKSLLSQCWMRRFRDVTKIVVADSQSEDDTVELAEPYVDEVLEVPRGKLTALDAAIRELEDSEIIVVLDADMTFARQHLNFLLRHFNADETVAAAGLTLDIPEVDTRVMWYNLRKYYGVLGSFYMHGGNRAFRRWAYLESPFRLHIDQLDVHAMIAEEELAFPARLMRLGAVVGEPYAVAYHPIRRLWCELGDTSQFCIDIAEGRRFS